MICQLSLPQEIYSQHLHTISGIPLTCREMEIIAYILNGRGEKKIASCLGMDERAVSSHTSNIRRKLGCNARESIIDFIEKSDKASLVKNEFYQSLNHRISFENELKKIRVLPLGNQEPIYLVEWVDQGSQEAHINKLRSHFKQQLTKHLKILQVNIKKPPKKEYECFDELKQDLGSNKPNCHIVSIVSHAQLTQVLVERNIKNPTICLPITFIVLDEGTDFPVPQEVRHLNQIDIFDSQDYYLSVLSIVEKLLPSAALDELKVKFSKNEKDEEKETGQKKLTVDEYASPKPFLGNSLPLEDNEEKRNPLPLPLEEESLSFAQRNGEATLVHENIPDLLQNIHTYKRKLAGLFVRFSQRFLIEGIASAIISCIFLLLLSSGYFKEETPSTVKNQNTIKNTPARSDIILPQDPVFLNRSQILKKIGDCFKGTNDIQVIALVGIGGAGKTTLARQYVRSQELPVMWEINAETKESVANSFKDLAYAFSRTPEEKQALKEIQDIKDPKEKEEKLLQIVKQYLKSQSNWFLIYDNLENLRDLQKYFPSDPHVWGRGRIIITTRNGLIQNNNRVNHVLWIEELSETEKLTLFMNIMDQGSPKPPGLAYKEEARIFLKNIPPFPLDICIAAYYLKATHTPYAVYEKGLKEYNKDFEVVQENILKESGNYSRTRYQIIATSLKKIMEANKNFGELLLFITILDSHHIPRDLLESYKGRPVVDNFIYHLKKYSLIANSLLQSAKPLSHIFIHHSTQHIGFSYLAETLKLNKDTTLTGEIVDTLDDYLDQAIEAEDLPKMQMMASHLQRFLNHSGLFTDFHKGLLESKLGCLYYFMNNDKSRQVIKDSYKNLMTNNLKTLSPKDSLKIARSLLHIGVISTELRFYEEAQGSLEATIKLYEKSGLKKDIELPWVLSHLGNLHRRQGNYEKARYYLEESIRLNKHGRTDNKRLIHTLSCLGSVYRGLGSYQKSIEILEESLILCQKYYSEDHFRIGRVLRSLGNVYRRLGNYKQAKDYLERSLVIYKKYFPENHINVGLALAYLGNCLRELGDYKISCDHLERSLKIHQKYFDKGHAKMGWILFHLANTYKALGRYEESQKLFDKVIKIYDKGCGEENIEAASSIRDVAGIYLERNNLDNAEKFTKESLNILEKRNHVDAYRSLEVLGEVYLKKSTHSSYPKCSQEYQNFRNQAISHLNQALKKASLYFPKDSTHIQRLNSKIKKAQEEKV